MTLTKRDAPGKATYLILIGAFDMAGVRKIGSDLLAAVTASNAPVILDFSEVDFLASSGMRILIEAHKALDEQGHNLVVLNPQTSVAKVFEIAGLSEVIAMASSEDEANSLLR